MSVRWSSYSPDTGTDAPASSSHAGRRCPPCCSNALHRNCLSRNSRKNPPRSEELVGVVILQIQELTLRPPVHTLEGDARRAAPMRCIVTACLVIHERTH